MLYSIFYGEISDLDQQNWHNETDSPYKLLNKYNAIKCKDWIAFLRYANKNFTEKILVDWGSYAWKTDKAGLLELKREMSVIIQNEKQLKKDVLYGIVFIEEP